jgi:hypothetical protein
VPWPVRANENSGGGFPTVIFSIWIMPISPSANAGASMHARINATPAAIVLKVQEALVMPVLPD